VTVGRPRKQRETTVRIFQSAEGDWLGFVTVGVRADGKPDPRKRRGKTREECAAKIRELEDQVAAGTVVKARRPPTVAEWLMHWCEKIARPTVSYSTYEGSYACSVYRYLIPGIGAHRLDKLEPEHIERLYTRLLDDEDGPGLSAGTVALIHRTLRAPLNEAVTRGRLVKNPALIARTVDSDAEAIDPLTVDECQRILAACEGRRNGARWSIAMLGLWQGEALALCWSDVDLDRGFLTVAGKAQRRKWQHGCSDPARCARWRHGIFWHWVNPAHRCGRARQQPEWLQVAGDHRVSAGGHGYWLRVRRAVRRGGHVRLQIRARRSRDASTDHGGPLER